jgi:hypothetical protein
VVGVAFSDFLYVALAASCIAALAQPAFAGGIEVVVEPMQDRELDEAVRATLNLPILISAGIVPADRASPLWEPLLEAERQRVLAVAQSFGYLQARVQLDFTADTGGSLRLAVATGPIFRVSAVQVGGIDGAGLRPLAAAIHNRITAAVGAVARGDLLRELKEGVLGQARGHAFPFATLVAEIKPHPLTNTASIELVVDLGPVAKFGPVTFDGPGAAVKGLSELVPFAVGDRYDPQKLREFEETLATAPRVRGARLEVADRPGADGMVSVAVNIRQAVSQETLARFKLGGIVTLGLALATLLVRQICVAARRLPARGMMIGLDMATFALAVLGLVFVVLRVTSFAQMA